MKLVIDIPDSYYEYVRDTTEIVSGQRSGKTFMSVVYSAVATGTPLKSHGRLIDADSLIKSIEEKAKRLSNVDTINGLCGAVALIFDEQTIIEAESEKT